MKTRICKICQKEVSATTNRKYCDEHQERMSAGLKATADEAGARGFKIKWPGREEYLNWVKRSEVRNTKKGKREKP